MPSVSCSNRLITDKTISDYLGGYAGGFVIRNEKLDFDRDLYLQQFVGSPMYPFMSSVAQTQMFEQVCEMQRMEFIRSFVS